MTGQNITDNGNKIQLNRTWKSTPDYGEPSVFKVGTGTTDPTTSDTDLQTPVTIDTGTTKAFVTGYPILDETNLQATVRCFLTTTNANGNSLTEFGLFNTDGTPLMFSRATHTPISKTTSIQVSYVEKDRLL